MFLKSFRWQHGKASPPVLRRRPTWTRSLISSDSLMQTSPPSYSQIEDHDSNS